MKIGVSSNLRSARECVELAVAADATGFWGMGIGDTAPKIYGAAYPTITAALLATGRLRVGPFVTNPVSQHWSVHAATARTLEELAPGRFFLGLATGDGALHSVGLRPAKWAELQGAVGMLRQHAPPGLEIHIAASGPKGMGAAGPVASDLMIATGLDVDALRTLAAGARAARVAAGVVSPLRVWALAPVCIVDREDDVLGARLHVRPIAITCARFAFANTFEGKNVPEELQPVLRERLSRYDFRYHGVVGRDAPNGLLFDDLPEVDNYLVDRMLAVGTPQDVGVRVAEVAHEAGLDGCWARLLTPAVDTGPRSHLELASEAFESLLAAASVTPQVAPLESAT